MINSFSERHEIIKPASLNPNEMPIGLKNRLWNVTQKYIDSFIYQPNRNDVIKYLWDRFFKGDVDALRYWENISGSGYYIAHIQP